MIRGIFYSEFDNIAGPRIVYQEPPGLLSAEEFDSVSEYVICKPQLCSKVMSVSTGQWLVMGCPVMIEHAKYHRNALLFNLGFVLPGNEPLSSTIPLRPVVRKLGGILQAMETENEFLYTAGEKERLFAYLHHIRAQLNQYGECSLTIDGYIGFPIHLQLDHHQALVSRFYSGEKHVLVHAEVSESQIPMIIAQRRLEELLSDEWDLSLRSVVPLIDGERSVSQIAHAGNLDPRIVLTSIQHLVYYDFVRLIDPLDHKCVYVTSPEIHSLYADTDLRKQCCAFVQIHSPTAPVVTFQYIFRCYCQLIPGRPFSSFLQDFKPRNHGIDETRFLQYGLLNRFVQRAQQYIS
eukprot:TRINITY_DN10389_c1_g1_i2.p1 TRINITY_DN10389_c1_g1~~TRINITY_DN10389_c1_g1_i2.p1  ORF type:complete len:349 (-),score=78.81 TRINITY_DN10389_c1_g1_i2:89-1135(-)